MKTKFYLIISVLILIILVYIAISSHNNEIDIDFHSVYLSNNTNLTLDDVEVDFDLPISSEGMRAPYLTNWIRHFSIVNNNTIYDLTEKKIYQVELNEWERLLDYNNHKILIETIMGLEVKDLNNNETILQFENILIDNKNTYIECINAILDEDKILCQRATSDYSELLQIKFDGETELIYQTNGNILSFISNLSTVYIYESLLSGDYLSIINEQGNKTIPINQDHNSNTIKVFWQLIIDKDILKVLFVNYIDSKDDTNRSLLRSGISVAKLNLELEDSVSIEENLDYMILLK